MERVAGKLHQHLILLKDLQVDLLLILVNTLHWVPFRVEEVQLVVEFIHDDVGGVHFNDLIHLYPLTYFESGVRRHLVLLKFELLQIVLAVDCNRRVHVWKDYVLEGLELADANKLIALVSLEHLKKTGLLKVRIAEELVGRVDVERVDCAHFWLDFGQELVLVFLVFVEVDRVQVIVPDKDVVFLRNHLEPAGKRHWNQVMELDLLVQLVGAEIRGDPSTH